MPSNHVDRDPAKLARSLWILPAFLVLLLCSPVMGFPYLWDDYAFLNAAQGSGMRSLLHHDPLDPFYRPISREIYFSFLYGLGPTGPLVGHLVNAGLLVASVFLLVRSLTRLLGAGAGVIAGTTFACVGVLPFLVGWVSGGQDAFAIFFVLLALALRSEGKNIGPFIASACALLSKETAVMLLPVVALMPWIQRGFRGISLKSIGAYAALGTFWALAHPGIRVLLHRRFSSSETDYVGGITPIGFLEHLGRYIVTLFNLPQFDWPAPWPIDRTVLLIVGIGVTMLALRLAERIPSSARETTAPVSRVLFMGGYMAVAPLALTAAIVQGWQTYYAGIGGLGLSIVVAALSTLAGYRLISAVVVLFLALGIWQRGQVLEEGRTTERNFRRTAVAVARIESGFRSIQRTFPPDSRVVVSVQARGIPGAYLHVYHVQALRQWYRDPTLDTVRPEFRRTRTRPEFFFVITPELDVAAIDPDRFQVYPTNISLEYSSGERAIRAFAIGAFASGNPDRATALLLRMPEMNEPMHNTHQRLAGALLLASGRRGEANEILARLQRLPRWYSLNTMAVYLAEPLPTTPIDRYVFEAFGIDWADRDALIQLSHWCEQRGYLETGLRLSRHCLQAYPQDQKVKSAMVRLEKAWKEKPKYNLRKEDGPRRT